MSTPPYARISSRLVMLSTLITSAPRCASILPAYGPAQTLVSSRTRTPFSGPPRSGMGIARLKVLIVLAEPRRRALDAHRGGAQAIGGGRVGDRAERGVLGGLEEAAVDELLVLRQVGGGVDR